MMIKDRISLSFVILILFLVDFPDRIRAISSVEGNLQNSISEEDRRGSTIPKQQDENTKDDHKKSTRYIHSATSKQQSYFYPSGYDTHIAATGNAAAAAGYSGSAPGSGSGYEYGSHHTGPSNTLSTHHLQHHHQPGSSISSSHHHGPTAYAASGYGGGYGSYGGHSHSHHGYGLYGGGGHSHSTLALKSLLIPLAGIALLGAAAALTTNPVLLQLGVVNGRRRRRSLIMTKDFYPSNPYLKPERTP